MIHHHHHLVLVLLELGGNKAPNLPTNQNTHLSSVINGDDDIGNNSSFSVGILKHDTSTGYIQHCKSGHRTTYDSCISCINSKVRRTKINKRQPTKQRTNTPFEVLHADTAGPISTNSHGKMVRIPGIRKQSLYCELFVDEASLFSLVAPVRAKSDIPLLVIKTLQLLQRQFNVKTKRFVTDNGSEFTNQVVQQYLQLNGILHPTSPVATPQLNGLPERMLSILFIMAKAMMHNSGAPAMLWSEAITVASYIYNRSPVKRLGNISPYQVAFKVAPSTEHFQVWGCDCYMIHHRNHSIGKFDEIATPAIFVGYADWFSNSTSEYRVLVIRTGRIETSRDVKFCNDNNGNNGNYIPTFHHMNWFRNQLKLSDSNLDSGSITYQSTIVPGSTDDDDEDSYYGAVTLSDTAELTDPQRFIDTLINETVPSYNDYKLYDINENDEDDYLS
jgi:hypothetical protein